MVRIWLVTSLVIAALASAPTVAAAQGLSGRAYEGESWEQLPDEPGWEYSGESYEQLPETFEPFTYEGEGWEAPPPPAAPRPPLDPWSRNRIELTAYMAGWFFHPNQEMQEDFGGGLRLTLNSDPETGEFGVSLDTGWVRLRHQVLDPATGRFETAIGNLNYWLLWFIWRPHFGRRSVGNDVLGYFNPWVGIGGGMFYYSHLTHEMEELAPDVALGLGVDWKIAEGVRVAAAYELHLPYTRLAKHFNSLSMTSELSLGLEMWF